MQEIQLHTVYCNFSFKSQKITQESRMQQKLERLKNKFLFTLDIHPEAVDCYSCILYIVHWVKSNAKIYIAPEHNSPVVNLLSGLNCNSLCNNLLSQDSGDALGTSCEKTCGFALRNTRRANAVSTNYGTTIGTEEGKFKDHKRPKNNVVLTQEIQLHSFLQLQLKITMIYSGFRNRH